MCVQEPGVSQTRCKIHLCLFSWGGQLHVLASLCHIQNQVRPAYGVWHRELVRAGGRWREDWGGGRQEETSPWRGVVPVSRR